MLVVDTSLLSDYLAGAAAAEAFLQDRTEESWAVPSVVLYEASMGAVHGYIPGEPAEIRTGVRSAMSVLDVTARTAAEGSRLQERLLERGQPAETIDTLAAATAMEHGGRFATGDQFFWDDAVRDLLDVDPYDRSSPDGTP